MGTKIEIFVNEGNSQVTVITETDVVNGNDVKEVVVDDSGVNKLKIELDNALSTIENLVTKIDDYQDTLETLLEEHEKTLALKDIHIRALEKKIEALTSEEDIDDVEVVEEVTETKVTKKRMKFEKIGEYSRKPKIELSNEELEKAYRDHLRGVNLAEIARTYGVNRVTISKMIAKYALMNHKSCNLYSIEDTNITLSRIAKWVNMIDNGKKYREIVEEDGEYSAAHINNYVYVYGDYIKELMEKGEL